MTGFRALALSLLASLGLCLGLSGQAHAQSDASGQLKAAEQRFGRHMQEGMTAIGNAGAAMDADDRTNACRALFRARTAYGQALDTLDEIMDMLKTDGDADELAAARDLRDNLKSSVAEIGDMADHACTPQSTAL